MPVSDPQGHETFRVLVMGYKGSIAYVQMEIDRVLRPCLRRRRSCCFDSLGLSTAEEKLAAISTLRFPSTLSALKTYTTSPGLSSVMAVHSPN